MKHEAIDDRARVWVVTRGSDGRLNETFDPTLLSRLNPGYSAEQVADAIVIAAGERDVRDNRLW